MSKKSAPFNVGRIRYDCSSLSPTIIRPTVDWEAMYVKTDEIMDMELWMYRTKRINTSLKNTQSFICTKLNCCTKYISEKKFKKIWLLN